MDHSSSRPHTTAARVALLRASKALQSLEVAGDERIGVKIIARAIEEPMRWIAANAGHEGSRPTSSFP